MTRRQQILDMIRNFWLEHRCAPTEREIAEKIGIAPTTARYHIAKLVEDGELTKITAGHRSLALPTQTQSAV